MQVLMVCCACRQHGWRVLTCSVSCAGMAEEATVLQVYTVLFWAKLGDKGQEQLPVQAEYAS